MGQSRPCAPTTYEAPYEGPLQVINASETTVTVQYPSGRTNVVSKERVKIAKATRKDLLSKPTNTKSAVTQPLESETPKDPQPIKRRKHVTFAPLPDRPHRYDLRPRQPS